jgi:hypothetical protein
MAIRLTETRLRQIIREEASRLAEMGRRDPVYPASQTITLGADTVRRTGAMSRPDRMFRVAGMSDSELRKTLSRVTNAHGCTWMTRIGGAAPAQPWLETTQGEGTITISGPDDMAVQDCVDELAAMGIA